MLSKKQTLSTYLSLMHQNPQHTSSGFYLDILGMDLVSLTQTHGVFEAVVQLGKGGIALVLAKSVYVGVKVGVENPAAVRIPRAEAVVPLGLAPYEIELYGDYKGRDVKNKVRERKTVISFGNHDGITSA